MDEIPDESEAAFRNDVKAASTSMKKHHAQQLNQLEYQISELTKTIAEFQSTAPLRVIYSTQILTFQFGQNLQIQNNKYKIVQENSCYVFTRSR